MSGATADDALETTFHAAADHLGQLVSANPTGVIDSVKLQLYGLYKQATVGKCTSAKPAFWDRAARMKWNHWSKLGDMSASEAMRQYIKTLTNVDPDWQIAAAGSMGQQQKQGRAGGPVFSTLRDPAAEQQVVSDGSSSLQEAAGQGDVQNLRALLDRGVAVNHGDESGSTALHFAADRGQQEAVQLLLAAGADVNAQDHDGQTPLHYAAACGQQKVYQQLRQAGADSSIQDADGKTAAQLAPKGWTC